MTKTVSISLAFLVIILLSVTWWKYQSPKSLTLRFYPYIGEQPLELNDGRYNNPGGPGEFSIRDLQLFISNINLVGDKQIYSLPDSYHLLRFDNEQGYFDIKLNELSLNHFNQVELGIGVDPDANGTIVFAGDLDPNGRMAWNWQVGYKFLLMEGSLTEQGKSTPLVYHIGFDESYTRVNFPLEQDSAFSDSVMHFKIDLNRLFAQKHPINMAEISTVKFDPEHVKTIAQAFPYLISVK